MNSCTTGECCYFFQSCSVNMTPLHLRCVWGGRVTAEALQKCLSLAALSLNESTSSWKRRVHDGEAAPQALHKFVDLKKAVHFLPFLYIPLLEHNSAACSMTCVQDGRATAEALHKFLDLRKIVFLRPFLKNTAFRDRLLADNTFMNKVIAPLRSRLAEDIFLSRAVCPLRSRLAADTRINMAIASLQFSLEFTLSPAIHPHLIPLTLSGVCH